MKREPHVTGHVAVNHQATRAVDAPPGSASVKAGGPLPKAANRTEAPSGTRDGHASPRSELPARIRPLQRLRRLLSAMADEAWTYRWRRV